LEGLSSVETIDGFITITNNVSLKTVEAFSSVSTLFGIVNISNNAALISITGFTEATEILSLPESGFRPEQGELRIESNASLKSIDGFSSLKKIAGVGAFLLISNNPALTDFNGLSALASIDGNIGNATLSIVNNQSLKNIDGLSSFSDMSWGFPVQSTGTININDNASLKNINGISAFRLGVESKIPTFFISIVNNPELKFCSELYPFLADLGWEGVSMLISLGNIKVEENGASCTLEEILATGPQTISSFSVINTQTGSEVIEFKDSVVLDLAQLDFPHLAIQANTFPKKVGSVELIYNHKSRDVENVFPYIFDIRRLQFGTNAMQANVYTKSRKRGKKGVGKKSTVTLINSAEILNFEVVDVQGNLRMNLNDGDKININDPAFKSMSIRANTTPASAGSVRFLLNHRFVRTENVVPYALNGDQDGNYYPWSPSPGDYTLTAIPYTKHGRNEYKGKSLTIHFKVTEEITGENYKSETSTINQHSAPQNLEVSISAYPVPVEHVLYVKINGEVGSHAIITVRSHRGDAIYLGFYSQHQSEFYSINTDSMQPGVYLLQIRGSNGIYRVMKFIKK
jgi:hypothetical protein